MHRVVPDLILENYRARNDQGSFRAVGLFLDLSGFSVLTDALTRQGQRGAEALVGLMHNIFDPLVKSIFEHGGRIVGFAGDGIMALFPIVGEERVAALHALASAWWIQQGFASRSLAHTSYGSFFISAKVGLAVGEASWGILHSRDGRKATYYFRGSAVEDSAHAERLARPGEIYLSQTVADLLPTEIRIAAGESFHRLIEIKVELPAPMPVELPPLDEFASAIFVSNDILKRDQRGEFRQAVNLFMRIPDLPDESLREFLHILFDLQTQYGGLLSRLDFGDKGCNMLMLWGAPVAYENDIGRALNFLLDLKARVEFPITAGVTYYIAHAGFLGGEISECYTCYGWGVNLASRFMMSAPTGSVWIDERIARRVTNRFDFEFKGAQKFKGFETEQKVFALTRRKSQADAPHQGEFVGREVEFSRLVDFLQPLWEGRFAGVMMVRGDAGIGKSRLVYELRASGALKKRDVLWAFCHSEQILRYSFNPFRYYLLRRFGITPEMDTPARERTFTARLDELLARVPNPDQAKELDRARHALGSLLDLFWPDSTFDKLDAEGRYNNILLALIAFFKAESLCQPIVLFIEDAQFLDEDSKAFLPRLKRALAAGETGHPVAIIVSSRHSAAQSQLDSSLADHSLELGALSMQALSNLAEIYLGAPPAPDLVRFLHERSEGNPYFAEQILVYLQEENLLEMGEKGWRATRRLHESSLPADIRALLMARLDQLSPGVRDLIQIASVFGREFDLPLLTSLRDKSNLLVELAEAESAEILTFITLGRFAFTHGLLRDAAYSMQMHARRQELHALALTAVENTYPTDLEHHYGELAYHAENANLTDKALRYLPLAGRRASGLYQNAQALDYFTRALSLLPEGEMESRFDLLNERVEIYKRTGNRKAQWEDIEALATIANRLSDVLYLAKAQAQRAHYSYATGDYSSTVDVAEQMIRLADGQASIEMADAYLLWFFSLLRLGKLDASMSKAQEGLSLASKGGMQKNQAHILNGMGLIAIEQNNIPLAMEYLTQAITIARQISEIAVEARALNNLGNVSASLGDYAMARDCYEQSYLSVHASGDRYGESYTLGNLGWVAGMQGDFVASRAYHQQALNAAREVGNSYQEAYTLINLSAVLSLQSDDVAAQECARLGLDLCRKIGERSGEAWASLNLAHAYLLAEELDQAQEAYTTCLAIREELRQPNLAAEALAGMVQVDLRRNDFTALSDHTDSLLAIMETDKEFSGAEDPLRIYFSIHQGLVKMKNPRSDNILQNAKELLEAQVSKFKDEKARRLYVESVPWRNALSLLVKKQND
jgi:predicted ATPase